MTTFLFIICLALGFWFSFVNICKGCRGLSVSWTNCAIMAFSLACTITMYMHGWY